MARTVRRRRRRNVWFDDKKGHRKAAKKGWGRRKAKARRIRRQRMRALAKARAARRRKASTRKHRKASRKPAVRHNPPRRRRRRNSWVNHKQAHRRAALKGWRRRKHGKRRATRTLAKARSRRVRRARRKVYTPSMYARDLAGLGSGRVGNPRRRRHRRRSNPRRRRSYRRARRHNPVIGSALAIPRKLPLVGQYFNMPMIKAAGGIGLGMLVGGGFGNMLYSFASSKLSFMADYPQVFKPVCILAAGAGAAVALSKLGWKNMSKYVILGAGAAVAVDLISPIFANVMSKIPGLSDYVQLADYVQLQDQAAVERGMLGGYNDYVQLPGVSGLPGFSDQSAVEAGLL